MQYSSNWYLSNNLILRSLFISNCHGSFDCGFNSKYALSVTGNSRLYDAGVVYGIILSTNTMMYSDEKLKINVTPIPNMESEKLLQLKGRQFQWSKAYPFFKRPSTIGFIAQELNEVYPDSLIYRHHRLTRNYLTVDTIKLIPLIVENLKIHDQKINQLYQRILE